MPGSPSAVQQRTRKSGIQAWLIMIGVVILSLVVWGVGAVCSWLFNPVGGVMSNAMHALPVASSWLDVKAKIGPVQLLTNPQHRAPALPDYIKPYVMPGDKCPFANDSVAKSWARFYETGIADGIWVHSWLNLKDQLATESGHYSSVFILYVDSQMGRYIWAAAGVERDGSGRCFKEAGPWYMAFPFTTLPDRSRPYNEAKARVGRDKLIREGEFSLEKPRGKGVRRPTPEEAEFILSVWRRGKINFPRRVLFEIHDQSDVTQRGRNDQREGHENFGLKFDQKREDLVSLELALRMHEMLTDTTPQEVERLRAEGIAYIMNN
jgi:hypothetical protein